CKKWVDFCNRPELYKKYDENGPEYLYKSSRICSDHFQPVDFNNPNLFSQGLKKGSVPSVNPANMEAKPNGGNGGVGGSSGGGGGGSGSSNGAGSPVDEKFLTSIANISNISLMMAAMAAASQTQSHSQLSSLAANLKRSASAMSGGSMVAASQTQTASTTTTPVSSKRNRAVPPLAAPTGALANLIQRQQQIKEQQMKEQQRKATALAAVGLVNGQVSITPANLSSTTSPNSGSNGGAISLVTTKKASSHNHNNNNNNNVSNHNHNHHGKLNSSSGRGRLEPRDHSEYGLNMVDVDISA
uniref:THAP-type domain-containing protein n=1 Tax=Anopheles epiroticus TaxID=199890 RepID=A0A182P234_9DIPT